MSEKALMTVDRAIDKESKAWTADATSGREGEGRGGKGVIGVDLRASFFGDRRRVRMMVDEDLTGRAGATRVAPVMMIRRTKTAKPMFLPMERMLATSSMLIIGIGMIIVMDTNKDMRKEKEEESRWRWSATKDKSKILLADIA
jgi:hypothetical protein